MILIKILAELLPIAMTIVGFLSLFAGDSERAQTDLIIAILLMVAAMRTDGMDKNP